MANIDVSVETDDKPAPPPKHPNTCPSCHSHYRDDELEAALWVCRQCGHHFVMRSRQRIDSLADAGSFVVSALAISLMSGVHRVDRSGEEPHSALADLREGFRFVRASSVVR